jgi:hypothetical protein
VNHFIELVTFKTKAGITPDQVISASDDVNRFLKSQPGFVSRNLGQTEDGTWHDILFWESQEHVMAAMEKVANGNIWLKVSLLPTAKSWLSSK